jgi:diguanylate cyclase (GGDEF)-like protein
MTGSKHARDQGSASAVAAQMREPGRLGGTSIYSSLEQALRLWHIDVETLEVLRAIRPHIKTALDGNEADLAAAFGSDPLSPVFLEDPELRREAAATLAGFWQAVVAEDIVPMRLERAVELGRNHFRLGLGSGHFLLASQRVLRRLVDAVLLLGLEVRLRAIDTVTRLVLLADDLALTAYFDSAAHSASEREVSRRTEELREQMRVLEELAHVDGLTKLFNRRHFDQALEAELDRCARHKSPLALLLADIDHFKQVNDQAGHQAGDAMLALISGVLHGNSRRSDVLARYGGEEFALILPNTASERAMVAAERLRAAVEQTSLPLADGTPLSITISIGVAVLEPGDTAEQIIRRADLALYRAKEKGRNQVSR